MCPEGNSLPSKPQTISCLNSQPNKNSWPLSSRNGKRVVSFSSRNSSLPSSYSQLLNYFSGSCAAASPQLVWPRIPPVNGQVFLLPPPPRKFNPSPTRGSEGQQGVREGEMALQWSETKTWTESLEVQEAQCNPEDEETAETYFSSPFELITKLGQKPQHRLTY